MKTSDFDNLNSAMDVSMALTRPVKTTAETSAIVLRWPNLQEPQQVISHAASFLRDVGGDERRTSSVQNSPITVPMDSE